MSRELLERAAKAAGIELRWSDEHEEFLVPHGNHKRTQTLRIWNPLADDGDALRLAVALGIADLGNFYDGDEADPYAATRLAIVRAAAAMGEKP